MNKKDLRNVIKTKLNELPKDDYKFLSRKIADQLFATPEWKQAKTVGITVSRFPEVDTLWIIQRGWEEGKTITVPKSHPQTHEMTFRILTDFDQLENVYFGLSEPIERKTTAVHKADIQLMIIPGIVFDKRGYRIGYGGGFYDRYLQKFNGHTIALAFQMQLINEIPIEGYDIPVKKIITENRIVIA